MDVLEKYVGVWSLNQHLVVGEREETAELVMTSRFVDCRTWLPSNCFSRIRTRTLMTYDTRLQKYRAWISWSNDQSWEATGEWNPGTKTMTWTAVTDEGTRIFSTRFESSRRRIWSIQDFDADGQPGWGTKGAMELKSRSTSGRDVTFGGRFSPAKDPEP